MIRFSVVLGEFLDARDELDACCNRQFFARGVAMHSTSLASAKERFRLAADALDETFRLREVGDLATVILSHTAIPPAAKEVSDGHTAAAVPDGS